MKNLKSILAAALISVALVSCEKEENIQPSTPAQPQEQECEINNWGYIYFENRSNSNTKFDIIWDGVRLVSNLAPGKKSGMFVQTAGSHSLQFRKAGTSTTTCSTSYPNLDQCTSVTFYCTY